MTRVQQTSRDPRYRDWLVVYRLEKQRSQVESSRWLHLKTITPTKKVT